MVVTGIHLFRGDSLSRGHVLTHSLSHSLSHTFSKPQQPLTPLISHDSLGIPMTPYGPLGLPRHPYESLGIPMTP